MKYQTKIKKLQEIKDINGACCWKLAKKGESFGNGFDVYNEIGYYINRNNAIIIEYDFIQTKKGKKPNNILSIERTDNNGETIYFEDFTTKKFYHRF